MNTTKIGDEFEQRVFKLFSELLARGHLSCNFENSKIFSKKRYYSNDRKDEIEVDISIESYTHGREQYSTLLVIECKNYSSAVPVNDIEEFHSKLQQIGASKGIVVSSNIFQRAALNVAQAKRIGLARLLPESELQWILDRSTSGKITNGHQETVNGDLIEILTNNRFESPYIEFAGYFSGQVTHSLDHLLEFIQHGLEQKNQNPRSHVQSSEAIARDVPFRLKSNIDEYCEKIRKRLSSLSDEIPIYEIFSKLEQQGLLKLEYRENLGNSKTGQIILGRISFNPTIITIARSSGNAYGDNYREKFTLAHELGHFLLKHHEYMKSEFYSENDFQSVDRQVVPIGNIARMEWQANYFASSLLLPRDKLFIAFHSIMSDLSLNTNKWNGALFVDDQGINLKNYRQVTDFLKDKFKVSRRVVEIALEDLGLVINKRKPPTAAGSIMNRLFQKVPFWPNRNPS